LANIMEVARPIPSPPPVTSPTFPSNNIRGIPVF
jgi:hypothetical protein